MAEEPLTFYRKYQGKDFSDEVIISINNSEGAIDVSQFFKDGTTVKDAYTEEETVVANGHVNIKNPEKVILLSVTSSP